MADLNLNADRAAALWNAQADQHNQWSELDADERAAWIAKCAAPVGEVELPALPEAFGTMENADDEGHTLGWLQGYTAEQYRQGQRDAIAPYAERIRVLERELSQRDISNPVERACEILGNFPSDLMSRAQQSAQSIGDDPEFKRLLGDWMEAYDCYEDDENEHVKRTLNALIAHIDGRAAGVAPDELIEIGNRMANTLEVLSTALKNPGTADGVRCTVNEWRAAAPSPQHGKEGGNDQG